MSGWIDISVSIEPGHLEWPGAEPTELRTIMDIGSGEDWNETHLSIGSHRSTHVDAPLHALAEGDSVDMLPIDHMCGPCRVVDIPGVRSIGPEQLDKLGLGPFVRRLLIRTDNSLRQWWREDFDPDFCALSAEGAKWCVNHGLHLVGMDYLSVTTYQDSLDGHRALLGAGVVLLETLDLCEVEPGDYDLFCLPVKVGGAEAAPARAVLRHAG